MSNNLSAFLKMIAISEGTQNIGDNGYNVLVGGKLFHSYLDHPRIRVWIKRIKNYSSAAGRYQILARNYDFYKKALKLTDFSPASQDKIALEMIKEHDALPLIMMGQISEAIDAVKSVWASLPGAGYNQHENKLEYLIEEYIKAGGNYEC